MCLDDYMQVFSFSFFLGGGAGIGTLRSIPCTSLLRPLWVLLGAFVLQILCTLPDAVGKARTGFFFSAGQTWWTCVITRARSWQLRSAAERFPRAAD